MSIHFKKSILNLHCKKKKKNRSAEYEKTAGLNLRAVIKYLKKKTIVHSKKQERLIFTVKKGVKKLK